MPSGDSVTTSTKVGLLLLTAMVLWGASEFDLVSRSPPELTAVAVQQLHASDAAADRLRQADAAKNSWLALWPIVLVVMAGLLFWDDLVKRKTNEE
jgi:hypothetical protein